MRAWNLQPESPLRAEQPRVYRRSLSALLFSYFEERSFQFQPMGCSVVSCRVNVMPCGAWQKWPASPPPSLKVERLPSLIPQTSLCLMPYTFLARLARLMTCLRSLCQARIASTSLCPRPTKTPVVLQVAPAGIPASFQNDKRM